MFYVGDKKTWAMSDKRLRLGAAQQPWGKELSGMGRGPRSAAVVCRSDGLVCT